MAVTKDMLLSELKDLLRLTAFEQTVATVRRAQAGTTPVEQELAANAEKSGERLDLLRSAVRQVGGVPDVVGPVLGRVGAVLQSQLNQVQTLQGALLGDLALEHQLRERTRYARVLAESLDYPSVLPVLDRLETAHSATIEWLETRLAEVGKSGSSALKATPVQSAVGVLRRTAGAPLGLLGAGVNRIGGLLTKAGEALPESVRGAGEEAKQVGGRVADRAADVADQATDDADQVIDLTADAASSAAERTEQVLEKTGGADVDETHPPFAAYDKLTGDSIIRHAGDTDDVDELRRLLAFEQAHKARKGVLQAAQSRLAELSTPAGS